MSGVVFLKIILNGKDKYFNGNSVEELINGYGIEPDSIVVERNGEIVHKEYYASERLGDGDIVEIVKFVGGG